MCVVSMVMDHYWDRWNPHPVVQRVVQPIVQPLIFQPPAPVFPSPEEIAEFYRLLARAREYDRKNNEPDCELASKKQRLLDLAKELGVEIRFDAVTQ